jgi:hypothetical protein
LNADLGIRLDLPSGGVRTDAQAREFYDSMAEQYVKARRKAHVTLFGEKTPEHTSHIDQIQNLFPDSKIIVLYRDGRDVALSLRKTPWAAAGIYANFMIWLYYQNILLRILACADHAENNLRFIRYEDVVERPETIFREVLTFLELPYESSVASGCGNREGIPLREHAWKSTALQQITAERVGAFRRELTEDEIAVLEGLGRDTLTAFGYPLLTAAARPVSPSVFLRMSYELAGFLTKMPLTILGRELIALLRAAGAALTAPDLGPAAVRVVPE